jgi:hypothetical protein
MKKKLKNILKTYFPRMLHKRGAGSASGSAEKKVAKEADMTQKT